jgi:hypothetical protein
MGLTHRLEKLKRQMPPGPFCTHKIGVYDEGDPLEDYSACDCGGRHINLVVVRPEEVNDEYEFIQQA